MRKQDIFKVFRSELIQNATDAEIEFKNKLDLYKIKYVFQHRIDYNNTFMIVDFYIKSIKMVIEVDGGYHKLKAQREKDLARDNYLKDKGYKVLRVLNEDIYKFEIKNIIKHFVDKKAIKVKEKLKKKSKLQCDIEKIEKRKLKDKKIQKKKDIMKKAYPHLFKGL